MDFLAMVARVDDNSDNDDNQDYDDYEKYDLEGSHFYRMFVFCILFSPE